MPDHPAIELTDVSLRHGRTLALDGVSATIPAGSVTGLVGRNGAGKTSLLRVIAGREPRHTGRVSVLAQPASRLGHTPGAVHLLCDTWGFAADLTVAGVGAHLRRLGGPYDQDRARDLLDRFGVPHDAPVGRLSRGQASAARLSLALASRAPITLLDEPTLGMDAAARALTTRVVIEELAEAPRTLVISTHLIDEAAPHAPVPAGVEHRAPPRRARTRTPHPRRRTPAMTTTQPSGAPTATRPLRARPGSRILAVVAALAGRAGWRLWFPVAAWLVAAVAARAWLATGGLVEDQPGRLTTAPGGVLVLTGLAALTLLWAWGARFALALGYARSTVFVVATVTSVTLVLVNHLLGLAGQAAELAVVGRAGVRVLALDTAGRFDAGILANPSWTLVALYLVPLVAAVVLAACASLRWGAWGLVGAVAVAIGGFAVTAGWVWPALDSALPAQGTSNAGTGLIAMGLYGAAVLVAAWGAFRGVRG